MPSGVGRPPRPHSAWGGSTVPAPVRTLCCPGLGHVGDAQTAFSLRSQALTTRGFLCFPTSPVSAPNGPDGPEGPPARPGSATLQACGCHMTITAFEHMTPTCPALCCQGVHHLSGNLAPSPEPEGPWPPWEPGCPCGYWNLMADARGLASPLPTLPVSCLSLEL